MTQATLEDRVSRLERLYDELAQRHADTDEPARDDWRRTFGMFAGDTVMKEIIDAGRRIREEDRQQAAQ